MSEEQGAAAVRLLNSIDEKLTRVLERMDGQAQRLALLDQDLATLGDLVEALGMRLNEIVVRLARIERGLDRTRGEHKA